MPFAFAGIWDTWSNRGDAVTSCAIITTAANELVGELHDRMPAILQTESYDAWLDPSTDLGALKKLLWPFPGSKMKSHPVSSDVNQTKIDEPHLITLVDETLGRNLSLF